MYNVLIVEDELLVRTGITASVNWEAYNMNVCASVADGQSAYNAYVDHHADVIITDIKMPRFDGLKLIKKIRETDKKCKIVVVTCLEDFNTLHEAFNMGISGYLLKATMKSEDLANLLEKIKEELDSTSSSNRIEYKSKNDLSLIKDYINGQYYDNGGISAGLAGIIGIYFKAEDENLIQIRPAFTSFYERIATFGEIFVMEDGNTFYYVLFKPSEYDHESGQAIFYELQNYIKSVFDVEVTAVAFMNDVKPDSITKAYTSMKRLLSDNYFIVSEFSYLNYEQKVVCKSIRDKFTELREDPVYYGYRAWATKNQYLKILGELEQQFCVSRRRFCDLLTTLARFVFSEDGIYANVCDLNEFCEKVNSYETAGEALSAFMALYPESDKHSLYSEDIAATTVYIQEHISENITLPHMASIINISPNYYASLFKQAVGVNFSEYLGKVRLDYACDMLMNTDRSIQEISHLCGFSDVTYFTRYFKSNLGQPPKRWRTYNEK